MSEILLRSDANAVAALTLNDPKKLNALSEDMLARLQSELDSIAKDRTIRAVIIKGSGNAFCAGHDLKQMTAARQAEDGGKAYFNELFATSGRLMISITEMPQPVIAQAHGIATAAGCQLLASCDMAVAAEGTLFGVNGVNIGLFCSTPMVALTRNIPRKQAFEMLTTGEFIDTEKALAFGLINRAVPSDALNAATLALAERVAGQLGVAVKIGKEAFYQQADMTLEQAYAYTGSVMADNMLLRDTEAGFAAFLEKRHPEWDQ
ncbi:MAG: enoyl-CoA hydratase [Paracoccaceae bacterium]